MKIIERNFPKTGMVRSYISNQVEYERKDFLADYSNKLLKMFEFLWKEKQTQGAIELTNFFDSRIRIDYSIEEVEKEELNNHITRMKYEKREGEEKHNNCLNTNLKIVTKKTNFVPKFNKRQVARAVHELHQQYHENNFKITDEDVVGFFYRNSFCQDDFTREFCKIVIEHITSSQYSLPTNIQEELFEAQKEVNEEKKSKHLFFTYRDSMINNEKIMSIYKKTGVFEYENELKSFKKNISEEILDDFKNRFNKELCKVNDIQKLCDMILDYIIGFQQEKFLYSFDNTVGVEKPRYSKLGEEYSEILLPHKYRSCFDTIDLREIFFYETDSLVPTNC